MYGTKMSEQKLLKLTTDFIFKRIFASNTDVLVNLLNAVLDLPPGEQISSLSIENSELFKDSDRDKASFFDITATNEKNAKFIIEMQAFPQKGYLKRALFYWAQAFSQGIKKGDAYTELTKVYSVNFLDFNLIKETKSYLSQFLLLSTEDSNIQMTDLLDFTFVEIKKFPRRKRPLELKNDLESWMYLFAHCEQLEEDEVRTIIDKNPMTEQVVTKLKELSADEITKKEYEAHMRWQLSHDIELTEARKEGRAEGEAKGKEEEKKIIAIQLLENGIDVEIIAKSTGLSFNTIVALKKERPT